MIDSVELEKTVRTTAERSLRTGVIEVEITPSADAGGVDALDVTLIVQPDLDGRLDDDALLETSLAIQQALDRLGEYRHAYVSYLTEDEARSQAESDDEFAEP